MQMVINIKKEDYTDIMTGVWYIPYFLREAIENGTVLPDDHGRLIDADAFRNNLKWNENIDNAPTILEARKVKE